MFRQRWGNKYGAKRTEYNGIWYDSKKEAGYARDLDLLKAAGEIESWERQITIPLTVNGYHICNYRIDFVATHKDGSKEYIEVKGFPTQLWQFKWRLFEALYSPEPNTRLTVIR